jgi:ADP-dependent NAD(P)H-hydrate dehydratase
MSRPIEPRVVTTHLLKSLPLPDAGDDKTARGSVVVVAGTASTPGAALLAAEAALRAGAGKLTLMTCPSVVAPLAVALPEAKVEALASTASGHPAADAVDDVVEAAADADAVLVGCGYADAEQTLAFLRSLVPRLDTTLLLDAAASVLVRESPTDLHHLNGRAILTVNPSELALSDGSDDGEAPADVPVTAARVARRSRAVVLCGGAQKHVVTPDGDGWVFAGGGPTLAVSGSGDVQAGIVAGLAARGADPARAAVWGTYLHGRAGERLAAEVGPVGSMAREQLAHIPLVLREVH